MQIIVSHPAMDFDALASQLAAKRLYPSAHMVLIGKANHNVQDFLALHGEAVPFQKYLKKDEVTTVFMVDTRNGDRLQEYKSVLDNEGVEVIIYDHHPPGAGEIAAATLHYAPVGANVTQLVELIEERGIAISSQDATIMALGIYEDTGSLSYASTTTRDLKAAAYLLEQGANLAVVANYIDRPITAEQQQLMTALLADGHLESINGLDIFFATAETDDFVGELAHLTTKLRDFHTAAAIFTIVAMGKRIYIVARSNHQRVDVRQILQKYQGGGFSQAASAVIKNTDRSPAMIKQELIADLRKKTVPPLLIRDIMTTPVKTIDANTTIQEVNDYLLRYGHSGYPVMQDGQLVGIISRRDVEKAMYHQLGRVPVKGYMSHHVLTIEESASVDEAQALMTRENIGRLPVLRNGKMVGIVSRSDLLRLLYGEDVAPRQLRERLHTESLLPQMEKVLPPTVLSFLKKVAQLADGEGVTVFLVGGFVRDLLLGETSDDLDLVVEGDGIAFAQLLAATCKGRCTAYERFGTAHLQMENYLKIDVASARTEYYEYPAALPQVEYGTLRQDLYRRDFTVNAMAISLNDRTMGRLVDFYNGKEDLQKRALRVLHNLSFVEDPTRLLRALRFVVRFDFRLEEETARLARKAVEDGVFGALSYRRLWQEVLFALKEEAPYRILQLYEAYDLWRFIFPGKSFRREWADEFKEVKDNINRFHQLKEKPDLTLVYFLLLVYDFSSTDLDEFFAKIDGRRRYKDAAYGLGRLKKFQAGPTYLDPVQWYVLRDVIHVEQLIVLYVKADETCRAALLHNAAAYRRIHIYSQRSDYRRLAGYNKGMLRPIIEDLAGQKLLGRLPDREQEIAYVEQNIQEGKYHPPAALSPSEGAAGQLENE